MFFAKRIPKPPKRDTKLIHLLWEHDPGENLRANMGMQNQTLALKPRQKRKKNHTHTHTHTHKTLRLTPDHEIADFLLACKCICDLGQWRSVLRQFLKGKIRNKMKHGLWVGPIPLSKCCNKCGSLWQEANKENMGGPGQTLLDFQFICDIACWIGLHLLPPQPSY
jgi:hypothetical protein